MPATLEKPKAAPPPKPPKPPRRTRVATATPPPPPPRRKPDPSPGRRYDGSMIGILLGVLFAALVWAICVALGLPSIVGIVAAILTLLIFTGGTRGRF